MATPLNERIKIIMHLKHMNATQFAELVGVQRSSISHLINGRNKPSLDFIQKLSEAFPDIDLHWLIHGTGKMAGKENQSEKDTRGDTSVTSRSSDTIVTQSDNQNDAQEKQEEKVTQEQPAFENPLPTRSTGNLIKVLLFYDNGDFEEYHPKRK